MEFFLGTQEHVRISHGKRAISVRATEVLLYCLQVKQIYKILTSLLQLQNLNLKIKKRNHWFVFITNLILLYVLVCAVSNFSGKMKMTYWHNLILAFSYSRYTIVLLLTEN